MIARVAATIGETRLHLAGMLDGEAAAALRGPFEALAAGARGDVVLDLSAVTFLDGAGLGALAYLHRRLGRRLRLEGATGQPRALLRDLGLGRLIEPPARPRGGAWRWAWPFRAAAQAPS